MYVFEFPSVTVVGSLGSMRGSWAFTANRQPRSQSVTAVTWKLSTHRNDTDPGSVENRRKYSAQIHFSYTQCCANMAFQAFTWEIRHLTIHCPAWTFHQVIHNFNSIFFFRTCPSCNKRFWNYHCIRLPVRLGKSYPFQTSALNASLTTQVINIATLV